MIELEELVATDVNWLLSAIVMLTLFSENIETMQYVIRDRHKIEDAHTALSRLLAELPEAA